MGSLSPEEIERILEEFGGREGVVRAYQEHRRNGEWLEGNRLRLIDQHPGKWVVVATDSDGEPRPFIGETLDEAFAQLDEEELSRRTAVQEVLDPNPPSIIPTPF